MMREPVYFPIKTQSACLNKWTWSTLWLANGTTASCHRVLPHRVSLDNMQNFHNTPEKITQREQMLRGEWPQQGCDYCEKIERSGGQSDRMWHNQEVDIWTPPELSTDPTATHVTPRLVEIFVNNTCNLKCLYCDPVLSSSIQRENAAHGHFVNPLNPQHILLHNNPHAVIDQREAYVDEFFVWLDQYHHELSRLHILGGEPFLQPEMQRLIDFFRTHPSPELTLNVVSNLMVKQRNMQNYIDQLAELVQTNHLGKLHISGSIDAWGPGAEYVRNGLDLEVFESNLLYILNNPHVDDVGLYQVITCFTIIEAPALYRKILEWRKIKPDLSYYFQLNTDWNREFIQAKYWGGDPWRESIGEWLNLMAQNQDNHLYELKGLWNTIKEHPVDLTQIQTCHAFLDELDRRRGTNWQDIFPYLNV